MDIYISIVLAGAFLFVSGAVYFVLHERQKLHRLIAEEQSRNREFSIIFHQINNFLTSVKWHSEMLQDKDAGSLTIAQQQLVHKISTGVEGAVSLLNAHFVISQGKKGEMIVSEVQEK